MTTRRGWRAWLAAAVPAGPPGSLGGKRLLPVPRPQASVARPASPTGTAAASQARQPRLVVIASLLS